MFVYVIVNNVNGKIYVGKTTEKNLQHYLERKFYSAQRGEKGNPYLFKAIRKYGNKAFSIHPLMSSLLTNEQLCHWETEMISLMRAQDPEVGYNICKGGEGFTGPHSEATRAKMSLRQKADYDSGKRRPPWTGKKMSSEHRAKMSASQPKEHNLTATYVPWNKGLTGRQSGSATSFKKGQIPWNKDTKGVMKGWNKGKSKVL